MLCRVNIITTIFPGKRFSTKFYLSFYVVSQQIMLNSFTNKILKSIIKLSCSKDKKTKQEKNENKALEKKTSSALNYDLNFSLFFYHITLHLLKKL